MALAGCSGSNGGDSTASDPLASAAGAGAPIFGTISSATGKSGISLTTDRSSVDVNNGQVLVTAKLIVNNVAVSGVPVTFSIKAPTNGPATIEAGLTTVTTDSNGIAVTRITTGNTLVTTNVIVQGTGTINDQTATATTTFQIVRGSGIIKIGTDGLLDPLSSTVDPNLVSGERYLQQIIFKVTDSNSNPRVGVPVTLSLYSQTGASTVIIDYLKTPITEPNQQTVTTDSSGLGIFNVSVTVAAPPPGLTNWDSIVYKAVTNDAIPIIAYVGGAYSVTSKLPPLVITPAVASFGTATDISFIVSGGIKPYSVSSNNTARVTATLQADGTTVLAHLVDVTAWTGAVTISAIDSSGQTVSATVTR